MTQKFFITGTGTGIGKTFVTTTLIRELRETGSTVRAIKPVISGVKEGEENDIDHIIASLRGALAKQSSRSPLKDGLLHCARNDVSLYRLSAPLSPDMAAPAEGIALDYGAILNFCKQPYSEDYLLIEGIGGVMVPLTDKTVLDVMVDLCVPVILVTGSYLGSISHTLTALAALGNRGIAPHALIVNESAGSDDPPLNETIATLKNFTDALIMPLPRGSRHQPKLAQALKG